ncbi:MAG: GIY-YIG nuclease family protein [Pseudomonadota bacterium]
MPHWVYIMASQRNGTLYIGMTSNLPKRAWEHREGLVEGFTKQHAVKQLVYIETHEDVEEAIKREKQLKNWRRAWKLALIEEQNPNWDDLFQTLNN